MTRDELIQLVRFVQAAAGTEDEIDRALTALDAHVPHPAISDLIFFPAENCERSAEEIVDTALSHEPIAPGISMETTPAEETVHEGKWLRMKRRGQWEYCERTHGRDGMAVIIIAVTPQDEVLFVEQYRVPLGARTIEMPAGLVGDLVHGDGMEDTLERAAQRELAEETGWHPEKVDVLLIGPTSSGMSSERIAFVRATGLVRVGDGGGVDGEDITVHAVPRVEAPAWLMRKQAEGYELDLKLWGGLWMIDRNPDGSPAA